MSNVLVTGFTDGFTVGPQERSLSHAIDVRDNLVCLSPETVLYFSFTVLIYAKVESRRGYGQRIDTITLVPSPRHVLCAA